MDFSFKTTSSFLAFTCNEICTKRLVHDVCASGKILSFVIIPVGLGLDSLPSCDRPCHCCRTGAAVVIGKKSEFTACRTASQGFSGVGTLRSRCQNPNSTVQHRLYLCGITGDLLQRLQTAVYRVRQKKSSPQKFFAVFSATAWDFNVKFYIFI